MFAFDKLDGSNFRAEWDRKLSKKTHFTHGFGKFGTRTEMIRNSRHPFIEAVDIFKEKYAEQLDELFSKSETFRNIDRVTVFGEFFGENSFSGFHDWNEKHDVRIFDVFLYKKGYLAPSTFIKTFENIDSCRPIFSGIFNESFIRNIEESKELKEGVVCKGSMNKEVFMFKIKTFEWLNKVKEKYGQKRADDY